MNARLAVFDISNRLINFCGFYEGTNTTFNYSTQIHLGDQIPALSGSATELQLAIASDFSRVVLSDGQSLYFLTEGKPR